MRAGGLITCRPFSCSCPDGCSGPTQAPKRATGAPQADSFSLRCGFGSASASIISPVMSIVNGFGESTYRLGHSTGGPLTLCDKTTIRKAVATPLCTGQRDEYPGPHWASLTCSRHVSVFSVGLQTCGAKVASAPQGAREELVALSLC